ncbi:MAG: arylesterase [Coraliomargarita sp.]|nr:arylesterase [Coraliomargarita sp.]
MSYKQRLMKTLFEPWSHQSIVCAMLLCTLTTPLTADSSTTRQILFFGDSLTAGYGLDPSQAYPALIQQRIETEGLDAKVNVGAVSGDTSAGGLRRIDWMLRRPVDVFILALGANDGLRGVNVADTEKNLQAILQKVVATNPDVTLVIAGMRLPPSMGTEYTEQFAALFPRLATENDAALIPFLLEGVGGVPELNLPDRIHPNVEGQAILAKTVWDVLRPLLE